METNKKLFRIKNGKEILGGVCQGLADYFQTDVLIFRIAFVILLINPLPSVLPYLILWAVIPKKESWQTNFATNETSETFSNINSINSMNQQKNGGLIGGLVLIILGIIFAFREYAEINLFTYIGKAWPLFFIGLGIWLIIKDRPNSGSNNQF